MLQCERPQGDLVRYDPSTDEFGVLGADGYIRTYFVAVPCASMPSGTRDCHNEPTNLDYFRQECKRIW